MDSASHLEVSKQFSCSKEQLYTAWTEPAQLKQWWKPLGKQLQNVVNDITAGGTVKYMFEGDTLTIDGTYDKVEPGMLLEYSWNWHVTSEPVEDASYKLSVRFEGSGNNATLSVTQTGFDGQHSIDPHKKGWEQALQQLSEFVGGGQSDEQAGKSGQQKPPVTGYNETPEQQKVAGG